ncbi:MAG TPA: hypothetical protein VGJ16_00440, partial [Pirellulales bacterium]
AQKIRFAPARSLGQLREPGRAMEPQSPVGPLAAWMDGPFIARDLFHNLNLPHTQLSLSKTVE